MTIGGEGFGEADEGPPAFRFSCEEEDTVVVVTAVVDGGTVET